MNGEQDRRYLARAIALASNGLYTTDPNPRVGCVIVKDNAVIAEGWHERAGGPHAEIMALQNLAKNAGQSAQGAEVFVSLEPCSHHGRTPPCAEALIEANVSRVVIAGLDPNPQVAGQGVEKLKQAGINVEHEIFPDLKAEAEQLNPGFIKRMRHQLPYVRTKIAASLDGRTAMASGESQWITGEEAREDVHRLRARSSVILTGIGTVLADDPSLNVRLSTHELQGKVEFTDDDQPARVILDSQLRMPISAKMLRLPGNTLIYTLSSDQAKIAALEKTGATVIRSENESGYVRLAFVLRDLAERGYNEVMVEAGANLNGALLEAGIIDELVLYQAPILMGDQAKPMFMLPGISQMAQKIELSIRDTRQIGVDWRIIAHPSNRKFSADQ
ncbi:bifunctional diaminohydroxyphosphoribosylaminopyrimidine deaminase/5-amino-6-(5-phosphoribosylamino)uracil reductase RibD [Kaarinaea lacus]